METKTPKTGAEFKTRFQEYELIKDFGKHHHSGSVTMHKHPKTGHRLIKKTFAYGQDQLFEAEVQNLKHLRDCPFVPKLHYIDKIQRTIYLSYCGKRPETLTSEQKQDVIAKLKRLKKEYNISRGFWYPQHPGFPRKDNITIHHGEVRLIDLGRPWKISTT